MFFLLINEILESEQVYLRVLATLKYDPGLVEVILVDPLAKDAVISPIDILPAFDRLNFLFLIRDVDVVFLI